MKIKMFSKLKSHFCTYSFFPCLMILLPMSIGWTISILLLLIAFPPLSWEVDIHSYMKIRWFIFCIQLILCILMIIGGLLWRKKNEFLYTILIMIINSYFILGISFPRFPQALERFRIVECRNNLKKIWKNIMSYAGGNEDVLIDISVNASHCPSSLHKNSYIYFPKNKKIRPLLMDYPDNHYGVINVLYTNGMVVGLKLDKKEINSLNIICNNNEELSEKQLEKLQEKIEEYSTVRGVVKQRVPITKNE